LVSDQREHWEVPGLSTWIKKRRYLICTIFPFLNLTALRTAELAKNDF
jgi:hypothetical protein